MAVFKCKMCGGTLEVAEGAKVIECDYCGTNQTLPSLDDEKRANLYDRAGHFRRNNDFDKAMSIYEQILAENKNDCEAYWSLVLCRYGIEYVEDPTTRKRVPTVNRMQFTSIFDDEDYKSAIKLADIYQKGIYEAEAAEINRIQKEILAISQKEDPFDVFICYKETDQNGRRTHDSVLANDLYHQLTQEGFKVFYAKITLEDKLGVAYEPYIFAALNSAKVMVVLGTKAEYFNAVWVKNEWSRYLALVKSSGGKKVLIPAYKDMDPYDLPEEFSHLQAQDMSKLGFMQDLIRGIKKIAAKDEPKVTVKETVVMSGAASADIAPLLKRVFIFLEDRDFTSANEYCEKVLDLDPENAQAYLGKLMADKLVGKKEDLKNCGQPLEASANYAKVMRYGDAKLQKELAEANEFIKERNRLDMIYKEASDCCEKAGKYENANMSAQEYVELCKKAYSLFESIASHKDSKQRMADCIDMPYKLACSWLEEADEVYVCDEALEIFEIIIDYKDSKKKAEECKRLAKELEERDKRLEAEKLEKELEEGYVSAMQEYQDAKTASDFNNAGESFESLDGYKDSAEMAKKCFEKKKAIEAKIRAEQMARIALANKKKKRKNIVIGIAGALGLMLVVGCILLATVFMPALNYATAVEKFNEGKYEEAAALFREVYDREDSAEYYKKCYQKIYNDDTLVVATEEDMPWFGINEKGGIWKSNTELPQEVVIPDIFEGTEVKYIAADSFDYNNVYYVNAGVDYEMINTLTVSKSVLTIESGAFYKCESLKTLNVQAATKVSANAFKGCSALTEVKFGEGLTELSGGAFYGCFELTTVTLPSTLTSIKSEAFGWCGKLATINYNGTIEQWNAIKKDSDWDEDCGKYVIHCTDGDIQK